VEEVQRDEAAEREVEGVEAEEVRLVDCQRSLENAGFWTGADGPRPGDGVGAGLSLASRASM